MLFFTRFLLRIVAYTWVLLVLVYGVAPGYCTSFFGVLQFLVISIYLNMVFFALLGWEPHKDIPYNGWKNDLKIFKSCFTFINIIFMGELVFNLWVSALLGFMSLLHLYVFVKTDEWVDETFFDQVFSQHTVDDVRHLSVVSRSKFLLTSIKVVVKSQRVLPKIALFSYIAVIFFFIYYVNSGEMMFKGWISSSHDMRHIGTLTWLIPTFKYPYALWLKFDIMLLYHKYFIIKVIGSFVGVYTLVSSICWSFLMIRLMVLVWGYRRSESPIPYFVVSISIFIFGVYIFVYFFP